MKFLPLNVNYSCPSPDPLRSRMSAQASVNRCAPPKKWLFFCYWLVYCENGCRYTHRHVAYHNKHQWRAF